MLKAKLFLLTALLTMAFSTKTTATNDSDGNSGSVSGRVTDGEQHALPGATVIIEDLHTGVASDINGFYTLTDLAPGNYTLKIFYVGYEPITKVITVTGDKVSTADIIMSEDLELEEVQVVGAFHGQRRAIQMQKEEMGVVNVVSADQVGKFPDSNIGDALKRINGVNVQYDQGEARFGQVRGTSADLTSVTINGNRLPSAEGDTRNVQLDLIPSDMIQTIELNKVVTADMDGDAIGGEINLVTKNTPYKQIFNVTAGIGYTWISEKPQYNFGLTWGDRFFNEKLGIMISGSYQYAPGGSDNTEFEYELSDDEELELKEIQVRQYYVTRQRQSYSLALDLNFNELNKISFKGIYNRRNDWENRYRITYKKLNSKASKQSVVLQTKAGSDDNKNARLERQQTMDFSLDGEHYFGNLKFDWAGSYSRATEDRPNERYAAIAYSGVDFGSGVVDAFEEQPYTTVAIPSIDDTDWEVDELNNSDQTIEENEYKGRINFTLPIAKGLNSNKLKFGAKYVYKDKSRETSYYEYDEDMLGDWRSHLSTEIRKDFMPGDQYPIGTSFLSKKFLGKLNFNKEEGEEVLEEEAGNYNASEQIISGFLRLDQKIGARFDATLGLRIEHTKWKTDGVNYEAGEVDIINEDGEEDTEDYETLTPTGEFENDYTNLLPSVLLKFKINDDSNIRASFTKTLSRPKYSALIGNKSFNISDCEATIGDPNTKPTESYNVDLSADYYFQSVGLVSLGLFYKSVENVNVETLGYYTGSELGLSGNEETFEVTQNLNAYDARIFGIEVAYQRDFGFITPALKCLGFYGNYTYTHSSTRNYNARLGVKDDDDVKMAGSPEHTGNASLYFEKSGFNARLSFNVASSFIDEMNTGSRELDRYYDKVNYLDFNASYTWGSKAKFSVFAEGTNLLNQPLRYYQGDEDRTMQVEYYGVKVNAGIKVTL